MPDREKVIKGLECCTRYEVGRKRLNNCLDCPYVEPIGFNQFRCKSQDMKEDALALLKKQQEEIVPYIDIDEAKCPDCKVKLTRQELLGENVLFEDFYDYCPRCGRKVKWDA